MGAVRSTARIPVDPLEPRLGAMSRGQVLKVIDSWNSLRLGGAEEVLFDGILVVSERNLDRTLGSMDVPVVRGPLVGLVLPHERQKLLGCPALGLEVIVLSGVSCQVLENME